MSKDVYNLTVKILIATVHRCRLAVLSAALVCAFINASSVMHPQGGERLSLFVAFLCRHVKGQRDTEREVEEKTARATSRTCCTFFDCSVDN